MQLQEMTEVAGEEQENKDDGAGKDDADESFGEDVEGDNGGDGPTGKQ